MAIEQKKSKLAKLKMPEKTDSHEMDMSELDAQDGEETGAEDLDLGEGEPEHKNTDSAQLDSISDDDLMAEVKKRGLMADMANEPDGDEQPLA